MDTNNMEHHSRPVEALVGVSFPPPSYTNILVQTSHNSLLLFDLISGRMTREVCSILHCVTVNTCKYMCLSVISWTFLCLCRSSAGRRMPVQQPFCSLTLESTPSLEVVKW